ncbi:unnamed protein product [Prorocentrum cordatum]|uniref:WD repeat-containing protein 6 n=1 Tax=Prorocentrum cordatum TaxID=2364126 RepID=A0ABN9RR12_9DINO|nr:unnamed protein product [Polarella glacialis]
MKRPCLSWGASGQVAPQPRLELGRRGERGAKGIRLWEARPRRAMSAAPSWDPQAPGGRGASIESRSYAGPVLAVASATLPSEAGGTGGASLLLAGVGPDLHALLLGEGAAAAAAGAPAWHRLPCVLGGNAHVHGIRVRDPDGDVAAVFGPQHLALVALSLGARPLSPLVQPARLPDWPLDVAWLCEDELPSSVAPPTGGGGQGQGWLLAVAFARVFVELWRFGPAAPQRLLRAAGPEGVAFSYTASLCRPCAPGPDAARLLCATGTFEGSIVLWSAIARGSEQREAHPEAAVARPTLATLAGHQGAVFRVRLLYGGCVALSASDDRTVRLWSASGAGAAERVPEGLRPAAAQGEGWACRAVLRGHGARVWDAVVVPLGAGGGVGVASACEDSVVRLFSVAGACLRELRGHLTRGVRCLEAWGSPRPTLVSGGEDGAVKTWPLEAGEAAAAARTRQRRWTVPGAADWIREVALLGGGAVVLATNFGRVYQVALGSPGGGLAEEELYRAAEGTIFTCLGAWEREPSGAALLWLGCADGSAVVLSGCGAAPWTDSECRLQAFEHCRVGAAFAGRGGHGALADHRGRLSLWRMAGGLQGLGQLQLQQPPGEKNQRPLCAVLLGVGEAGSELMAETLGCPGLVWAVGDEHGCVHAAGLRDASCCRGVHGGKVLSLCEVRSGATDGSASFLSSGSDGAIVLHRLEACGAWRQLTTVRPGCGLRQLSHLVPPLPGDGMPALLGAFQGADFVLWDVEHCAGIWRHRCGGGKRPSVLHATRTGFTFAYSSGSKTLEVHDTEPGAACGSASSPSSLRQPLHGREIHSVAWVSAPTAERPGLFATAAEDTTLRLTQCAPLRGEDAMRIIPLQGSEQHPGAVRAVASARLGGSVVVLSGGAKGVLRLYALEEGPSLRLVWSPMPGPVLAAAAAGRPSAADDKETDAGAEALDSEEPGEDGGGAEPEERVMAIDCLQLDDGDLLVTAASSVGLLRYWLLSAVGSSEVGATVAREVRVATTAALCVRCLATLGAGRGALVGTADGFMVGCSLDIDPAEEPTPRGAPWPRAQLHDAGVNDLAVLPGWGCPGQLLVASAGDDQQIALALLEVQASPPLRILGSRRLSGAHSSSVRSVAWAAGRLLSLGLDRRLRVWDLDADGAAASGGCPCLRPGEEEPHAARCVEPEALSVAPGSVEDASGRQLVAVALVGRGMELAVLRVSGREPGRGDEARMPTASWKPAP